MTTSGAGHEAKALPGHGGLNHGKAALSLSLSPLSSHGHGGLDRSPTFFSFVPAPLMVPPSTMRKLKRPRTSAGVNSSPP
jgi:hypothetical protein